MILGFHEYWDKKKTQHTYFREKIFASVGRVIVRDTEGVEHISQPTYGAKYAIKFMETFDNPIYPKLHTLRLDQFNRWKATMSIQMVYRGPKYSIKDHFNKGIPELEKCKSTQKVKIRYDSGSYVEGMTVCDIYIDDKLYWTGWVHGKNGSNSCANTDSSRRDIETLANNDGFENSRAFFQYFNKTATMKMIHWTDLRY